jgi:hypothetical protein
MTTLFSITVTWKCGHTVSVTDSEVWRDDDALYMAEVAGKAECSACMGNTL